MDPTRCEGGCGRWVFHPERRAASRQKRFCDVCSNPKKRLVPVVTRPLSQTPVAKKARRLRRERRNT